MANYCRAVVLKILLRLVRGYQYFISPLFLDCCRFSPSCSCYAVEALEKFGLVRGGYLAFLRILRCQPLCHGGYDPVPDE